MSIFVTTQFCFAQEKKVDQLKATFEAYSKTNLQEKIFVHTDRDFYLTGELIWFKVYCLDGAYHRPLALDKVAYLEVVDHNKQPVLQTKVALDSGRARGSVFVPTSLTSGVYTLRVYTQWMKNFQPDFYFHKPITIVNPFIAKPNEVATQNSELEAAFFPEGGNLIAGVENKVAFKISSRGKGTTCKGVVVNQLGDTVTRFAPPKFGLGNFVFVPSATDKYKALIITESGGLVTHALPEVRSNGFAIQLQEKSNEINVRVAHRGEGSTDGAVYLFIHARQVISKAIMKPLQNNEATFPLGKKELPEGISHLTVFDSNFKPVGERLYFKKPENKLSLQVSTNSSKYNSREKVNLSIQASQDANISVAVARMDSLSPAPSGNISQYIWLQSDLTGNIESPDYYFSDDEGVGEATDNLMLTHGWRRFKWDSVLNGSTRKRYAPEHGNHQLLVKIVDDKLVPVTNHEVFLSMPGKQINLYPSITNSKGEAIFEVKDLFDTRKVVLQGNRYTDSTSVTHMELVDPFSKEFSETPYLPLSLDSAYIPTIVKRSVHMQALDIYHRKDMERYMPQPIDTVAFYGTADENYWLDQYTRFPVMEEVMREYVKGVMVRKRKDRFHFILLNTTNHSVFRSTPLILLDGVPIFNENEIMSFDPLKIKRLEVVTRKYYLGGKIFPGIVSYKTYRGDLAGFELDPKSVVLNYEGLAREREFYSPNYTGTSNKRIPDFRTLLYWKPDVNITHTKTKSLDFFTSDLPGHYQVVVQGVSSDGKLGAEVIQFEVR